MKKILTVLLLIVVSYLITSSVSAQEVQCKDRYLTIVNPVRGRSLWIDRDLTPLKKQYELIKKHHFPATWLLQFDVLQDSELFAEISKFDNKQEKGVFLEISQNYSEQARVIYPHGVAWFNPKAVFLSGYSQSERRRLIDKLFSEFKSKFGYFPKSVGAWWIDSYSLDYMKGKYNIKTAMIVADQKTTDNYGVWGQWWGGPFYPSKVNTLTPASSLSNKQDVVIIQWAQRDPTLAYGVGSKVSNYSLQANDYIRQGKDTKYFNDLINVYLDCKNPIGQITVGLETGIESVGYINEFENQLKSLATIVNLNRLSMSQFADRFSRVFPLFPQEFFVGPNWIMKTNFRSNNGLNDRINYQQGIAFKDYFIADKESFLDRNLERLNKKEQFYFPYYLLIILATGIFFYYKRLLKVWTVTTLFVLFSFGLILRSKYSFGWQIFYGSQVSFLMVTQIIIIIVSYLMMWLVYKVNYIRNRSLAIWFIPLSFGLDFIIQSIRFSHFTNKYYLGFSLDSLRFVGLSLSKPLSLGFVNQDFSSVISSSLLRINFNNIWDNLYLSLLIYPLIHILLAIFLSYIYDKLPIKIRHIAIVFLIILAICQLVSIFQADPRLVQ